MMIIDRARELRKIIEKTAQTLTDEEALKNMELYAEWKAGEEYKKDQKIKWHGVLYKILQDHTSMENWPPVDSPSLYTRVLIPDPTVIPEWEQPDSTNPYMKGDKVKYKGEIYESIIDNNVWPPDQYGWQILLQGE